MMRKFNRILLLAFALSCVPGYADDTEERADNVFGNGFYPGYVCDECRSPPPDFPMDFAAVASNEFFGDNPWLRQSNLGMPFRVYNLQREYVVIWFEGLLFDIPSLLPNLMDIRVRLENGQVITITVLQNGPELPVGEIPTGPEFDSNDSDDDGGGDGDEDDDYEEPDDYEFEEPEHNGVVDIEDPDENDEFTDWEDEL